MKSLFLASSFFLEKLLTLFKYLFHQFSKKKRLLKDFIFNPYENRNKTVAIMIEIFSSTKWICKTVTSLKAEPDFANEHWRSVLHFYV